MYVASRDFVVRRTRAKGDARRTSKVELASDTRKGSVECVSAPLYVCWRDKKASLPNFPRTQASRRPSGLVGCAAFTPGHSPCLSLFLFLVFSRLSQRALSNEYSRRKQFRESVEETIENLYGKKFRRERREREGGRREEREDRGDIRKLSPKLKLEISESYRMERNKQFS